MSSTQTSQLQFPDSVRRNLAALYRKRRRLWLAGTDTWPISINLRPPSEQQARAQLETVTNWINAWREWKGGGEVIWCERHWRVLGTQRLPERVIFTDPSQVTSCIGQETTWRRASARFSRLRERWPVLSDQLSRLTDVLETYDDDDMGRLEALISWVEKNPQSSLYPRQLPIAGLDSKWFERHRTVVARLIAPLSGDASAHASIESLCGLLAPPQRLRMRLLDPTLRASFAGVADITAPIDELASSRLQVAAVFIVENLQTGLSFADLPGSVVLMAKGYGIQAVARFPWLMSAACFYWGDIDTHGFAILSGLRAHVPHVHSLLMDETTLHSHASLWIQEPKQHSADILPFLTPEEHAVYDGLKQQRWGQDVRFEQERIAWQYAWDICRKTLSHCAGST